MTQALNGFEQFVLVYLGAFVALASILTYVGSRAMASRSRKMSDTALKDLLANDYYEAVSILVPAFNAEDTVVDTIRSLLNLQHPQFDIVVVNDGSTDETLERLVAYFSLVEVPIAHDGGFETQMLNVMYRSLDHANLTVIDKDHGGRADSLNAAMNLARRPLVCVVDADVVLDPLALASSSRRFVEDETVVAVTGLVRPDDESMTPAHRSADWSSVWVERFQEVDHARRTSAAAGWGALGAGMDVEGFVIFRRRSLLEIGGWTTETDIETVLALHRLNRARRQPYRVLFTSEDVGHMQAESSISGFLRWHGRRTRAVAEALWGERRMLGRPRYGIVGSLASPYRWIFEVGSVFVETAAYAYLAVSAALGSLNVGFAIGFLVLAPGSRIMLAQLATASNAFTSRSVRRSSNRLAVFAATIVEQLGIAQVGLLACIDALIRGGRKPQPVDELEDLEAAQARLAG
jgi:cellulose synthase/poly-beta-1,6-N-acetylglucosamine synthase-like glycosyltransferase